MAERARARRTRIWAASAAVLLGCAGAAGVFLTASQLNASPTDALSTDSATSTDTAGKWGRIIPVGVPTDATPDAGLVRSLVSLPAGTVPRAADVTSSTLPHQSAPTATVPAASATEALVTAPQAVSRFASTSTGESTSTTLVALPSAAPAPSTAGAPDLVPLPDLVPDVATAVVPQPQDQADVSSAARPAPAPRVNSDEELLISFGPAQLAKAMTPRAKPALRATKPTGRAPVKVRVKPGDSLYGILKSRGLPAGVLPALLSVGEHGERLKRIRPGQALDFYLDGKGRLERLEYRPDALTTVSYRRDGRGFASALTETELEARERTVTGAIESSLFLDGQRAGLSNRVIMQMAEIFGWDVDFALDLRSGDRFTIIYNELLKDGRKFRDGEILAAEFINRGRVFRAVRYEHKDGTAQYYTPEGRSMRKAFLRTPVRFARISSRFNLFRKHPVLHKVRAHRGVDYAAPTGTPVKATGDGRVEFRGRKGGYGKTIIIRHTGGVYSTLYAHLNGYAKGIRAGKAVRQGQTIGYVGRTGLATGPHLHYEFRVRGRHKDPLRVRLPKSLPIAKKHKRAFQLQTRKLIARLNAGGTTVAQND